MKHIFWSIKRTNWSILHLYKNEGITKRSIGVTY